MNPYQYYRKRVRLKQYEVAKAIGVDRTAVAKWECGKAYPTANKLKTIASLYKCTVDELLTDDINEKQILG